jgi:hypothetical protein
MFNGFGSQITNLRTIHQSNSTKRIGGPTFAAEYASREATHHSREWPVLSEAKGGRPGTPTAGRCSG